MRPTQRYTSTRETVKIVSNIYIYICIGKPVPSRRCPETSFPLVTGGKQKERKKKKKKREGTRRINGATLIALRTGERALSKSVLNLFPALLGLWNTEAKREKETRE